MLTFCREATENTPAALHEFPNSVVVSRAALALDAPYWLAVLEVDAAVHAPGGQPGLMPACFRTGQPLVDYATSILARC
jgi:hypothetical protein